MSRFHRSLFFCFFLLVLISLVWFPSELLSYGKKKAESAPALTRPAAESKPLRAKSSPGAKVFFVDLKNGAKVKNPFTVKFGISGIELTPAGEVKDNSGHHHLLIDVETLPPMDQPLPATDKIIHFGKAQTETTLTLSPGPHTLQLLLAGGNHIPNDPPVMSDKIKIVVE